MKEQGRGNGREGMGDRSTGVERGGWRGRVPIPGRKRPVSASGQGGAYFLFDVAKRCLCKTTMCSCVAAEKFFLKLDRARQFLTDKEKRSKYDLWRTGGFKNVLSFEKWFEMQSRVHAVSTISRPGGRRQNCTPRILSCP